jgi:hypothetical protein
MIQALFWRATRLISPQSAPDPEATPGEYFGAGDAEPVVVAHALRRSGQSVRWPTATLCLSTARSPVFYELRSDTKSPSKEAL